MENNNYYNQHCLIEASAGTGKTWTIIDIYKKLLLKEKIDFEKILIVTFTEKATGELKKRIYDLLRGCNDEKPEIINHVLENFNSIPIYTIHGFCQMLLGEYSFENNVPFSTTLVSQSQILESSFGDILKEYLNELNQSTLPFFNIGVGSFLLLMSDYPGVDRNGILKLKSKTSQAIDEMINHPDIILFPESDTIANDCLNWEKQYRLALKDNNANTTLYISDLKKSFMEWKIKKKKHEEFEPLHLILLSFEVELCKRALKSVEKLKQENSFISYSDMLNLVENASKDNPAFIHSICTRFNWAIVDEFQDTDHVQWSIFKNLFLNKKNKLILVGDPKQSIYRFRGADIFAYLDAKQELKKLSQNNQANILNLKTNYRSDKRLIAVMNKLFSHKNWFIESQMDISYEKVLPAENKFLKVQADCLPEKRKNLNLIVFTKPGEKIKIAFAKARLNEFIGNEINFLISKKMFIQKNNLNRHLEYKDIVILVRSKKEAKSIKKHLDRRQIPSGYYKEKGLFEKTQALEFLLVLEAIENPQNESHISRLALTKWFFFQNESEDFDLKTFLNKCNKLATSKKWPQMFSLLSWHRASEDDNNSRFEDHIIYKQIEGILLDIAILDRFDIKKLIEHLKYMMYQNEILPDEQNLLQNDIQNNKVAIMTIHASKGLEFPIVFLAGGLTQLAASNTSFYKFHKESECKQHLHLDFSKSKSNKSLHEKESLHEEKRMMYVACTRACIMLYLPFFKATNNKGPTGGFLYDILQDETTFEGCEDFVSTLSHEIYFKNKTTKSITKKKKLTNKVKKVNLKKDKIDFPNLKGRQASLQSFTSMHSRHKFDNEAIETNTIYNPQNNQLQFNEQILWEKQSFFLKNFRGASAGNVFHEILESIQYSNYKESFEKSSFLELKKTDQTIIKAALEKNGYHNLLLNEDANKLLLDEITNIVIKTLTHNLDISDDKNKIFNLAMLSDSQKIHEMDFIFKSKNETSSNDDFLNGSIDLIFSYEDKYFIVDWKSNFCAEGYSQDSLIDLMNNNDYHLQYLIYCHALNRFLESKFPDYTYDNNFGGVLYLFLRGIGIDKSNLNSGVFFTKPPLEKIQKFLNQMEIQ